MKANFLKKTLAVLAILMLLAITLLACGAADDPEATTTEAPTTTQQMETTFSDDTNIGLLANPQQPWTEIVAAVSSWSDEHGALVWTSAS